MSTIPSLLMVLAAGVLTAPAAGISEEMALIIRCVENVLESDRTLLDEHRGYLGFLEKHPEIAVAEDAYSELILVDAFRQAAEGFEDALQRDPSSLAAFKAYCGLLAQDADVRLHIEALFRVELSYRRDWTKWAPAMAYLRGHPDDALRFLENPARLKPTPAALEPLLDVFRHDIAIRPELLERFRALHENPLAHLRVYPWWQALSGSKDIALRHQQLMKSFVAFPHRFWVWHRRALALAGDGNAGDWIRHWHAVAGRTEGLGRTYWAYMQQMRSTPEIHAAASRKWTKEFGATQAWPPADSPPLLTYLKREQARPPSTPPSVEVKRPTALEPRRPSVKMPSRPVRPEFPAEPDKDKETRKSAR